MLPGILDAFRPQLILYQAGMDCWENDYMGPVTGLDETKLMERDRLVFTEAKKRSIPVVFNLAGGYTEHSPVLHAGTYRTAMDVHAG